MKGATGAQGIKGATGAQGQPGQSAGSDSVTFQKASFTGSSNTDVANFCETPGDTVLSMTLTAPASGWVELLGQATLSAITPPTTALFPDPGQGSAVFLDLEDQETGQCLGLADLPDLLGHPIPPLGPPFWLHLSPGTNHLSVHAAGFGSPDPVTSYTLTGVTILVRPFE